MSKCDIHGFSGKMQQTDYDGVNRCVELPSKEGDAIFRNGDILQQEESHSLNYLSSSIGISKEVQMMQSVHPPAILFSPVKNAKNSPDFFSAENLQGAFKTTARVSLHDNEKGAQGKKTHAREGNRHRRRGPSLGDFERSTAPLPSRLADRVKEQEGKQALKQKTRIPERLFHFTDHSKEEAHFFRINEWHSAEFTPSAVPTTTNTLEKRSTGGQYARKLSETPRGIIDDVSDYIGIRL